MDKRDWIIVACMFLMVGMILFSVYDTNRVLKQIEWALRLIIYLVLKN